MKKVILALAIVSVSFVACNDAAKTETPAADTTAAPAPVADTTAAPAVDTTKAPVADTTKK
ncbi:MAG: hypothetical protein WAT20_09340 [Ferruginibacter sp.]|nr:hypothetical protein [Chitinophagaceae bacterium]